MRNLRRMIASISLVAILSTLVVSQTAFAQTFTDVDASDYYYNAVEELVALEVITAGTTYNPAGDMERGLAAKYTVMAAGYPLENPATPTFLDVPKTSPYYQYVETAVKYGIVSGYSHKPGYFGPVDTLTREQYAKMTVVAFDIPMYEPAEPTFPDVSVTSWSYPYVETAYYYQILNGNPDGTFRPTGEINRADGAVITQQALYAEPRTEPEPDPDPDVPSGDLEVSLSADNPEGDTLPSGATSVPVAMWDFTANGGAVTLETLSVHTYGVTSLPGTHSLYLYDGTDRLTSGKSVNSSTNLAVFSNVNLDIASGETLTLTLKLDTGTVTTAAEAAFEIAEAEAVDAGDAEVSGDFPVQADLFTLSTVSAGTVTIQKNGTITNPKVGEDDATIAKFKIGTATEAGELEQLGLIVTGTISNDAVENFELYVSGEDNPLATVDGLNTKDLAVFVLDEPYVIAKGDTKSFWVKADFNTGRSGDTVQIYVDQTTDVVAIGDKYGYGMSVVINTATTGYDGTTTACTSSAGTCSYSVLQGGDVTVTSGGPAADDIGIGGDDIHLMDFSIVSVADITIKNWPVYLQTTGFATAAKGLLASASASNFTDIKIINTESGETLMGPIDADQLTSDAAYTTTLTTTTDTSAGIGYYLFADEFSMEAGEELSLALTTDVYNATALDAETIYGVVNLGGTYPQIKDVNNKTVTNSSSLVPASAITGKIMTVSSPGLTTTLAAVPVSGATVNNPNTYVKGQKDVDFVGITAKCGAASDCTLTDIALTGYYDQDNSGVFAAGVETGVYLNAAVGSVWIEDGDRDLVAAAESVSSAGAVTYDNVSYTIPAGETVILYVVGDISSNAVAADNVAFSLADAGISFEDADGTTRTSSGAVNGTTSPTSYVSVSAGGTLTITVDSSTPRENLFVAGTADNEVSKFKFTTLREPFLVKALSISAKQLGVTTADLAEYDNNVSSIKISYTNSDDEVETKTGYLTNGVAQFTGMDMFIEKNDDAALTVYTSLNTITGGATAGEFVDLNIAVNNFEALAQSSGSTYKASELDATNALLSIGTRTWTTTGVAAANGTDVETLGAADTVTVNDLNATFPVGTLLMVDDDGTYDATESTIFVLTTGYTDGGTTFTGMTIDNADTTPGTDTVYYSLPGAGYLTNTNRMYVYKTKPTLALTTDSPSGTKTATTTDTIMKFSVTPNAAEDLVVRQGLAGDDENDVNDVAGAIIDGEATAIATSGDFIDGAAGIQIIETTGTATDGMFLLDETYSSGAINAYDYVSFWMKINEVDDDSDVDFADFNLILDDDVTPDAGTAVDLGSTTVAWANGTQVTSGQEFTDNTWVFFTLAISGAVDADDQVGFAIVESTEIDASDPIFIDGLFFHNEMIVVDMSSNAVLDLTPSDVVDCTLKDGSTSVMASAVGVKTTSAAAVAFAPMDDISGQTDYPEVTISDAKTYTLVCDTSALVSQSVNNDSITPKITAGTSSDGTVTRGGFWWSANETTKTLVYWLGNVSDLVGNTLNY